MDILSLDPRESLARYEAEKELRYRVLRAPLGMGRHEVGFAGEESALHIVAVEGDEAESRLIGCVLFDFASGRLRAMAVEPERQRQGVGEQLVRCLERDVCARGVTVVTLHARETAVGFYEKLGYVLVGEPFVEVGLVHREMAKDLVTRRTA